MICFPNAKINLGLHITGKRKDGFHNIETIFYPIGLSDVLEWVTDNVNKLSENLLKNSGLEIDGDKQNNLCIRAYELLCKDFNLPKLQIHLHKIIPFGAGLGGGSSNAAYMIFSLNKYFKLGLSTQNMMDYARKLGSDCAFFIENKPVFAWGKGDEFESVKINLNEYYIAIVCPDVYVSTKEAYAGITPKTPIQSIKNIIKLPIEQWKENLVNDFEYTIFKNHPGITKIKEDLYKHGAIYASMSGSGSAVFGIFEKSPLDLNNLFSEYFVWEGKL